MDLTFVPLRRTAITPRDVVLGNPYDLSDQQCCETCLAAIIHFSSSLSPPDPSQALLHRPIGTLRQVQSRHGCRLCQIFVRAVLDLYPPYASTISDYKDDAIGLALSVLDGRLGIYLGKFNADIKKIVNLVLVEPTASTTLDSSEELFSSLPPCSRCSTSFSLCRNSGQIDLKIIKSWLRECETHHNCGLIDDETAVDQSKSPAILMDVQSKRLVMLGSTTPRYCALSYVYGTSKPFRTTRKTLSILQKPGALDLPEYLPPATVRDAMIMTDGLGEKYLWVDSLCIIHDDEEFLEDALKSMGEYYRQAIITIASVSTSGASEPIPGVLPGSRHHLPWIEFGGNRIFASPVSLHLDVLGSKYESRAWTYQERLLATRTLYITKHVARLDCSWSMRSELEYDWGFSYALNPLHRDAKPVSIMQNGREMEVSQDWSSYFELVRSYSQKHLTYSSDALAAFMGILETLSLKYRTTFVSGIPVADLLMALHWIPAYDLHTIHNSDTQGQRDGFPSWSWVAREGPIEWLEAVVLPNWWGWEGVTTSSAQNMHVKFKSNTQLMFHCQISSVSGISAQLEKAIIYSEKILDPELGLPMPLIKIFDSQQRWCGRICHHSPGVITSANPDKLKFMLISTCIARKTYIQEDSAGINEEQYMFDSTSFPTVKEGGDLARLCNVLLIRIIKDGYAERLALCQIHSDVWERMEKGMQALVLV